MCPSVRPSSVFYIFEVNFALFETEVGAIDSSRVLKLSERGLPMGNAVPLMW